MHGQTSEFDPPIRAAAAVILLRGKGEDAAVLMGQRGHAAAFMPSKFVFPGGAVEAGDAGVALRRSLSARCAARLAAPGGPAPQALAVAAIRELFEETGLALGESAVWPGLVPEGWREFAGRGLCPDAAGLQFVFRAITPPGRSRRFDARFFLADATGVAGDIDDFSAASDELSHLHWIALDRVRTLDLPFITEVVLAEVRALLRVGTVAAGVPFFDNSGTVPRFCRL
ncbi:MAG: NUDIX hydrolase [Pseudorhodobacter sp.]|nr:NUDIX hydrolase [Pseudorhodobacter sp.]